MQVWNVRHMACWKWSTQKSRHLGTIAQLCRTISSQLRRVSTIGKKLVKQQYVLQMSPQYGEHRPTNGWERLAGLGHPIIFQRVSRLGSVRPTARQSSSGHQPNCGVEQRAPPTFGMATITLGIGPHSSLQFTFPCYGKRHALTTVTMAIACYVDAFINHLKLAIVCVLHFTLTNRVPVGAPMANFRCILRSIGT